MNAFQPSRRVALGMLLASAGLAAACGRQGVADARLAAGPSSSGAPATVPSLARAALVHDALMLLVSDSDLTGEWQDMLLPLPVGKPFEFSYAYGVASLKDDGRLALNIAREVRADWNDRDAPFPDIQRHKGEMIERRLGIAIGWAANRMGAPVLFHGVDRAEHAAGLDGAFLRSLMQIESLTQAEATRTFRLLYERTFMAMHTLEPDLDGPGGLDIAAMHEVRAPNPADVNRFIDNYVDWIEGLDAEAERLGAAMAQPAPAGIPSGRDMYDISDPIIEAVENLRQGYGRPYPPGHWDSARHASRYGGALAAAYGGARLMLDVARGRADIDALDRLSAA